MEKTCKLIDYKLSKSFDNIKVFTTTKATFNKETPRFTPTENSSSKNNLSELSKLLGISIDQLVFPRQTHSNNVTNIFKIPKTELHETDAMVTNQPGICLCIQTADCVPIVLFDPVKNAVGAVHAGWRGTVANIVGETIYEMQKSFQTMAEQIYAIIGPSISPQVYEVGEDVIQAVIKNIPNSEKTLIPRSNGKIHFDLWEANRALLLKTGVKKEKIEIKKECSFLLNEKYFSARREGKTTGRMVTGIMLT